MVEDILIKNGLVVTADKRGTSLSMLQGVLSFQD